MIRARSSRPRFAATLFGGLALAVVAGCDQPTGSTRPRSKVAQNPAPVAADPAPAPEPEPLRNRPILGERTTEIRDAQKETRPGAGGVETPPRITAKDPITLAGNAYVTAVGQASILNIQHALDLYQATNGEYPKTYDEFMGSIIKENNIALPLLPAYQEYGYDAPTHRLVVLEYPDRKARMNYPGAK